MSAGTARGAHRRRLLVSTLRYPPYVAGGYELLTRDVAEALRARGHTVSVLCGRGGEFGAQAGVLPWLEPALERDGRAVDLYAESYGAGNLERFRLHFWRGANARACARALRETRAELLVFFNLALVSIAPIAAARALSIPTLGFVSDPWPQNHWVSDWRRAGAKPERQRLLEQAWRGLRATVDLGRLLVPSEYLRRELVRDGIPAHDLERLPLALPRDAPPPRLERAVRARADGEALRVFCGSMLWEGKGQHVLLEAAERAQAQGVRLELRLAGTGTPGYRARLEELARSPALHGRVQFLGLVSRAQYAAELEAAHVFALPSVWGEPFALAPLEALASGSAVVVSDAGGSPELVEHGASGWVARAGDAGALCEALVALARDEGMRQRLARAGRERVARAHMPDTFVDGFEHALERALECGPR